MNAQRLLDAMEHISDTYILHAQARLGYFSQAVKPRPRPVRRIFTVALAAAMVVI